MTMDTSPPPSRNTANDGTLYGAISLAITKTLQSTDDMLPARVIAYDRETNRALVQPLIVMLTTANTQLERAQIASIPVLQLGGGGFVLSFPINPGDIGWIKANDRDISNFLQSYLQSPPNTIRQHTFADAMFIPDTMFQSVVINEEDADNVVLQTIDGTCRIAISSGTIKLTAPAIVFDSPSVSTTGSLTVGTNSAYNPAFIVEEY